MITSCRSSSVLCEPFFGHCLTSPLLWKRQLVSEVLFYQHTSLQMQYPSFFLAGKKYVNHFKNKGTSLRTLYHFFSWILTTWIELSEIELCRITRSIVNSENPITANTNGPNIIWGSLTTWTLFPIHNRETLQSLWNRFAYLQFSCFFLADLFGPAASMEMLKIKG